MKTLIKVTVSLILFLVTVSLQAQTTPEPPKPPKVHHSEHSDSNSSSYSYSVSSSENGGKNKKTNVSISISNSDDSYTLRAKFPTEKYQEIKDILTKEISKKNYTFSKGKNSWISEINDEEVYKVNLKNTKLSIYLDKEIASSSLAEKFEAMGLTIRTIIVGKQNQERRDAERLQRQADRLKRDAERMQREANRLLRDTKKHTEYSSNNYSKHISKITTEAKRLADKASDLNTKATYKGATSAVVKELLGASKTSFNKSFENHSNWTWPNTQKEILNSLKKDNFINNINDVVFIKDAKGMHVNGQHLSKEKTTKYNRILSKNNISKSHYFTFYKTNNHIVLIDDNSKLDNFIDDVISKKILISTDKKIKLALNGNSSYINGNEISEKKLKQLNTVLLRNHIIPTPGKIFEIMKPGNYKLGYSLSNGSRHLGSWYLKN